MRFARISPLFTCAAMSIAGCSSSTTEDVQSTGGALSSAGPVPPEPVADSNIASFKALDATTVHARLRTNMLVEEVGTSATRTVIDDEASAVEPIDGTTAYVEHRDGTLGRETGTPATKSEVDAAVEDLGTADTRAMTDSNVQAAAFQPIGGSLAYAIAGPTPISPPVPEGSVIDAGAPDGPYTLVPVAPWPGSSGCDTCRQVR